MKNIEKMKNLTTAQMAEWLARDSVLATLEIEKHFGIIEKSDRRGWEWWLEQEEKEYNREFIH